MHNIRSIVAAIALTLAAQPTMASEAECSVDGIQIVRDQFLAIYESKRYSDAATAIRSVVQGCYGVWEKRKEQRAILNRAYFWAFSDYMLALRKAGDLKECIGYGKSTIGFYPKPYDRDDAPEILASKVNIDACQAEWEKKFASFTSNPCEVFNFAGKDENRKTSISVPRSWNESKDSKSCVAIHEPEISSSQLDRAEGGRFHAMDRPYLILVTQVGDKVVERFYVFSGGRLGSSEVSASGAISAGGDAKKRLVRFHGGTPYLWGGSASMATDALYELKSDGVAELVEEIQTAYH